MEGFAWLLRQGKERDWEAARPCRSPGGEFSEYESLSIFETPTYFRQRQPARRSHGREGAKH